MQGARLHQRFCVEHHPEAFVHLYGQFDGRDRCQSRIAQHGGHPEVVVVHDAGNHVVQFLFEHVHRNVRLFHGHRLFLGFGQCPFVHFLVLVQRNGVYLHGDRRYHVWRFLVEDEAVECLNVDGLVAHDVGCNEFSATRRLLSVAIHIECLHGGILDARELTYHAFHLFQLDAEPANLHLSVASSHKLDVSVGQIAHDVARAVSPGIFLLVGERIGNKHLGGLLRPVQIAVAHLRTGHPQLSRRTDGQTVALCIDHVEA